jgi:uncharacterized protein
MTLEATFESEIAEPPALASEADNGVMTETIKDACAKIAPLWPLRRFIAVNPFLGFADRSFEETCAHLQRVAKVDVLMPRSFYRAEIAKGFIRDEDIWAALEAAPAGWQGPRTVATFREAMEGENGGSETGRIATVAEILDRLAAGDRHASRTAFMIDEISKFCAAWFDEGQAVWRTPARETNLYAAWRTYVRDDRNPEMMGVRRFRETITALPADPVAAIEAVVARLGIPKRALADYLFRALFDVRGWASYVRYLVWESELQGRSDDRLVQFLAIRVCWGYALFCERADPKFLQAWRAAMADAAAHVRENGPVGGALAVDLILHVAYEAAHERALVAAFNERGAAVAAPQTRPELQAAFCIDVRSETFRRALESVCPGVETVGFAGFFGFPIEYVPIGHSRGNAQCPALLKPSFIVCEAVYGASAAEQKEVESLRLLRRRVANAWKSFKLSAIACFCFVETAGLVYAGKLAANSLGLTRPVTDPNVDGMAPDVVGRLGPRITAQDVAGRATGFSDAARLDMAEAVLTAMSMKSGFAPLVLLAGHGSSTVNNPHASGLDCGACGGHTGEANARVAAAILNDAQVRSGLRDRGIAIPDDTWFVACLHDTTTDEVAMFDVAKAPASHAQRIANARVSLDGAGALVRAERAAALGVHTEGRIDDQVRARARDWSQVRPEWGLAGNRAFVAAPRRLTAGLDLQGRAFLHSYDWKQDTSFAVLDLILTAPMVVASWINLQYFASTTNNAVFGAGNKTLHNVVGAIGVLEGNSGDLRVGLPLQSVHDGQRFVHDPVRLNVFIAAPVEAISQALARHAGIRMLADNGWISLFALSDEGRVTHRYKGGLKWDSIS